MNVLGIEQMIMVNKMSISSAPMRTGYKEI